MKPLAVLLMAFGSPEGLRDVEPYYTEIRGGRPPSPEALAALRARYERIGGRTPLGPITRAVGERLEAELGSGYRVYVGMLHSEPRIADAVRRSAADGAQELVALVLAPHYSRFSIEGYRKAAQAGLQALAEPPELTFIERWHDHPGFRTLIAERIREALAGFPPGEPSRVHVVFTAHSLPERILGAGDPYPQELQASAAAIAALAGLDDWELAYQSAGRTAEPWLGPDLLTTVERLAAAGRRALLVVPFGFTSDHLEILYDIDVETQAQAQRLGVDLRRIAMPNADPAFVAVLADLVRRYAPGGRD